MRLQSLPENEAKNESASRFDMSGEKRAKALDKFFDVLEGDMRAMSVSERNEVFEKLTKVFNDKIVELKRHQSEVEYGQHVEGLYNINAREAYLYDGGWKFHG